MPTTTAANYDWVIITDPATRRQFYANLVTGKLARHGGADKIDALTAVQANANGMRRRTFPHHRSAHQHRLALLPVPLSVGGSCTIRSTA